MRSRHWSSSKALRGPTWWPISTCADHRGRATALQTERGAPLATRSEQELVAEATLATLWRMRARREPVLIVIDEAHNVCPAEPQSALSALATEHAVRISAEGRKFGLYLFIATQRPQKVHLEVLSQCDNVVLLRMNSPADLQFLGEVLSFVPPGLTERASAFRQGEALVAGKISSHTALVRFGGRISQEGGADVAADWARPVG